MDTMIKVTITVFVVAVMAVPALAAPPPMTREEIINRGKPAVTYSYWWGNGCWRTDGTQKGSCSGSCPNCTHTGSYGADCSGYVAKVWQVPDASEVTRCMHPYSTYNFTCQTTHWTKISRGNMLMGDAGTYRVDGCPGTGGHIILFEKGDGWGTHWAYEAKGCSSGIVYGTRTMSSSYIAIRRNNIASACVPTTEVCNGKDDNCNGLIDEGDVCEIEDELKLQVHAYESVGGSDIDGDGKADVCARAAAGIVCYLSSGTAITVKVDGPALSDASGWSDDTNSSTLRLADINGDGKADLCARANAGIRCWLSQGTSFGASIAGPELSDATGWNDIKYYSTIRFGDINGDGMDDLCARHPEGMRCYVSTGNGFGPAIVGPTMTDESGWGNPQYYGTIRMGDVNGDGLADICARGAAGIFCWLSNGAGFPTRITGPAWSNAAGWDKIQYWSTIRLADINGDGKMDICGRSSTDFRCHLSTGSDFGAAIVGPSLADASGWNGYDNYATIRMADFNGDGKADVCARANAGWRCWPSTGTGFGGSVSGPELSDATGWNLPNTYRTIRMADVNGDGKADVCARDTDRFYCWLSTGSGFGTKINGPTWSNAGGWGHINYYPSIRMGGPNVRPCIPSPEVCDGQDNDCDGVIDNGGVCDTPILDPSPDAVMEVAEPMPDADSDAHDRDDLTDLIDPIHIEGEDTVPWLDPDEEGEDVIHVPGTDTTGGEDATSGAEPVLPTAPELGVDGCGCRVAAMAPRAWGFGAMLVLLFGVALLVRRRRA